MFELLKKMRATMERADVPWETPEEKIIDLEEKLYRTRHADPLYQRYSDDYRTIRDDKY